MKRYFVWVHDRITEPDIVPSLTLGVSIWREMTR